MFPYNGEIRKGLIKLTESKKKERLADWLNTLIENYQKGKEHKNKTSGRLS